MPAIRTHYDNLKVARNAPQEVIRAAYRTLSLTYHPDKNPGNPDAARIMAIINKSYEVLSDPVKRREHDEWIAREEHAGNPGSLSPPAAPVKSSSNGINVASVISHIFRNWLLYGFLGLIAWVWMTDAPSTPKPSQKPYVANPLPTKARPAYVRPQSAPNGEPWPSQAGYVGGFKRLHTNGLSSVTIDNTQNDADVFVKLVSIDGPQAYPVRTIFIPAFSQFKMNRVSAGAYDIRYRDLNSGALSRSDPIELHQEKTESGTRFSNITVTLYKVQHGNMRTHDLREEEF